MAAEEATAETPLYPLPQPEVSRQKRCAYEEDLAGRALVIDNGSYSCKAGWAGEEGPRVVFRSMTSKPRNRGTGQQRACVGDWGPGLKGWDFGKHAQRALFDGDIPYQLEAQEQLLDWAFDRLSLTGGSVDHPVLFTHPPLGPPSNKAGLAELLFEAYRVPALQFAAPGPCAFHYYAAQGSVGGSGLVVSSGHSSTYLTALYRGQPQWQYTCRSGACGALGTAHLQQLLQLRYPQHAAALGLPVVEQLKERYCYCAQEYSHELREMQEAPATAGGKAIRIQLPWTPPQLLTPEEAAAAEAAKAARAEEARQRLKNMAVARRTAAIEEAQDALEHLEEVEEGLDLVEGDARATKQLLSQAKVASRQDLQQRIAEAREKLDKLHAAASAAATGGGSKAAGKSAAAAAAATANEGGAHEEHEDLDHHGPELAATPTLPGSPSAGVAMEVEGPAATPQEVSVVPKEGSVNPSGLSSLPSDREGTAGFGTSAETADSGVAEGSRMPPPVSRAAAGAEAANGQQGQQQEVTGDAAEEHQQQQAAEQEPGFELLGVPASQLTEEQRKVKRRQQVLKAGKEARARAKARKEQQEREEAACAAEEDAAHAADPAGYLAALQQRHAAVAARLAAKKRRALGWVDPAQAAAAGLQRRGRRTGAEQRERMRLMVQAVESQHHHHHRSGRREGGKGGVKGRGGGSGSESDNDSFGAEDADWDVYKHMQGGSDSDEGAEDEAEYAWTTQRLRQLGALTSPGPPDAAAVAAAAAGSTPPPGLSPAAAAAAAAGGTPGATPEPPGMLGALGQAGLAALDPAAAAGLMGAPPPGMVLVGVGPEGYIYRPLTAEDFQLVLGVERPRIPELLLQPAALVGLDHAGLPELIMSLLRRMPPAVAEEVAAGGLLLTGGNAAFPGLATRLQAELTASRPLGKPIRVVASADPVCDAWRGGSLLASDTGLFDAGRGALGLQDYEEGGLEYLQEHCSIRQGMLFPELAAPTGW